MISSAQGSDPLGMPNNPAPLPPSLVSAAFTATEARALGVPASRLRANDIVRIRRGLHAHVGAHVSEAAIVAAQCRSDPGCYAAGLTAARLLGLPLPGALGDPIIAAMTAGSDEVPSPPPSNGGVDKRIHLGTTGSPRRGNPLIRWSRSNNGTGTLLRMSSGLVVTDRVRTFVELSDVVSHEALVAIGDHLVRRPRRRFEGRDTPYVGLEDLRSIADAYSGRGAVALRRAVSKVRMSSDSPAETRLRLIFAEAGFPEPLANQRAWSGEVDLGEPDLHWPQYRVAVEHEGPRHLTPEQKARDIARTERRVRQGWIEVCTVADDLAFRGRRALDRVRWALEKQGWDGTEAAPAAGRMAPGRGSRSTL